VIFFLDASALVKAYVRERGTEDVRKLFRRPLAISMLSLVEVRSGLRRREREGALSRAHAEAVLAAMRGDLAEMWAVEARKGVLESAADLLDRHPLRAYDAVQLASAIAIHRRARAVTFVCADATLLQAALAEGLRTLGVG
jgi:predicted nucleic acid-binding protein